MKTKVLLLLCLFCVTLSGCTHDANRVFTVCKETSDSVYAYNTSGDFVKKDKTTGVIEPYKSNSLINKPALLLNSAMGEFELAYVLPNQYSCDFINFNRYLNHCVSSDNAVIEINNIDYKSVDVTIVSADYKVRCYYSNNDIVRLYAVDSDDTPIHPPYISEGM